MEQINALRFVIEGSFCSFRDPNGAKYQQTYWFPPKTTVIGFLGSALGLEPPELEPLYDLLRVGVVLESWQGFARDLWGYTKLKGSAKAESAVVIRELIYQPRYAIFVSASDETELTKLQSALLDPVFALRFGRGEDLAIIDGQPEIVQVESMDESPWLSWTLLPFTLQNQKYMFQLAENQPLRHRLPIPTRMPVRLRYDKNWVRTAEFSWVTQVFDLPIKLVSSEGIWTDGQYTFSFI